MAAMSNRGIPVQSGNSGLDVAVVGRLAIVAASSAVSPPGDLVWGGLLRVLQRITHYKHGDRLEFKISFSVRDLLTDKGRAVKDQVEALVQAVQKAGSYQAQR